ncbi:MAG: hypothetical protein WC763_05595 [Candidatus Paceibacterota bacterium]|jgi:hypothetical protein
MAAVLDTITGSIFKFLTRPGAERGCGQWPGYERATVAGGSNDEEMVICRPIVIPPFHAVSSSENAASRDGIVWMKPSYVPDSAVIASGRSCPPNTYPFGGSCEQACPANYERELSPGYYAAIAQGAKDKKGNPTDQNGNIILPRYECRASCINKWHVMNWVFPDGPAQDTFGQQTGGTTYPLCYHPLPSDRSIDAERAVNMPYNLEHQYTFLTNRDKETGKLDNAGGFLPQSYVLEDAGVYAARRRFELGAAGPAVPCTLPNQLTAMGNCVRPCAPGHELFGEKCVLLTTPCPPGITTPGKNDATCIPITYEMPRYPSILVFIGILALIAVLGGLAVKLFRSRVSAS